MERLTGSQALNPDPAARGAKAHCLAAATIRAGNGDKHKSHRLLSAATPRAGDAGHSNGPGGTSCTAGALSHGESHRIAHGTVALKQGLRHPKQRLLNRVGIGNHATNKAIRGSGHRRQGRPQPTASAALSYRQRLTAATQLLDHHTGQAVVIGAEAGPTGAGPDLRFKRSQQDLGFSNAGCPGREAQLHLTGAGVGSHSWVF